MKLEILNFECSYSFAKFMKHTEELLAWLWTTQAPRIYGVSLYYFNYIIIIYCYCYKG